MKKRSLIVVLAILCIATSCFVSSTFAKFTTTVNGSAVATVAEWTWSGTATTDNFEIDLADTIKDSDGTSAETDVAAGVIAPGTSGTFQLTVKNESQVNGEVLFNFNTASLPFAFTYSWDNGADPASTGTSIADAIPVAMGDTLVLTVNWTWTWVETSENEVAGDDLSVAIQVTMSQVD